MGLKIVRAVLRLQSGHGVPEDLHLKLDRQGRAGGRPVREDRRSAQAQLKTRTPEIETFRQTYMLFRERERSVVRPGEMLWRLTSRASWRRVRFDDVRMSTRPSSFSSVASGREVEECVASVSTRPSRAAYVQVNGWRVSGSGRMNLSAAKRSLAHRDPKTNEEQKNRERPSDQLEPSKLAVSALVERPSIATPHSSFDLVCHRTPSPSDTTRPILSSMTASFR